MSTYSIEHINFIKKRKKRSILIICFQILIILTFLFIWELLAKFQLINTFLCSSPTNIYKTIIKLATENNLWNHIYVTLYETLISFIIASFIGIFCASILWFNKFLADVLDPYLTIINSLPKVALGPLIIIWVGANTNSIIFMALMISSIVSIINIYNSFVLTDALYIKLLKSFKASKWQIFTNVILPSNIIPIINTIKLNVSMSLIGLLPPVGEF